jgi:hypothetical protein
MAALRITLKVNVDEISEIKDPMSNNLKIIKRLNKTW